MGLLFISLHQLVSEFSLETSSKIQSPLLLVSLSTIKLSLLAPVTMDSQVPMVSLGMWYSQTYMAQMLVTLQLVLAQVTFLSAIWVLIQPPPFLPFLIMPSPEVSFLRTKFLCPLSPQTAQNQWMECSPGVSVFSLMCGLVPTDAKG